GLVRRVKSYQHKGHKGHKGKTYLFYLLCDLSGFTLVSFVSFVSFAYRIELLPNRIKHPVDEFHRFLGTEGARQLERLVDHDRRRRAAIALELAKRHPEYETIEDRHPLGTPALGGAGNQRVDGVEAVDGVMRQG